MGTQADDDKAMWQREQNTLIKIANGEISNLECPYCFSQSLTFSYTFVEPDNYGVWLKCQFCGGEAHLKLKARPAGYNEEYIIKEFQERDEQAIASLKAWRRKKSEYNQ